MHMYLIMILLQLWSLINYDYWNHIFVYHNTRTMNVNQCCHAIAINLMEAGSDNCMNMWQSGSNIQVPVKD